MPEPVNHLNNRFKVEIDGIGLEDFAEVILPEAYAEVVEYREGTEIGTRKLPGAVRYGNLVLRRGVTQSQDLFLWWKSVADGAIVRRSVIVILLDERREPVKRWSIRRAWPARYTVSPLVACDGDVTLMESLECATEGFEAVL
jgi:phage tail-like protein